MKYEDAVKELEEILAKLDDTNLSLDEALKLFEKSVELSKFCFEKLKEAEGKVEIIKKQLDEVVIKPFDDINN